MQHFRNRTCKLRLLTDNSNVISFIHLPITIKRLVFGFDYRFFCSNTLSLTTQWAWVFPWVWIFRCSARPTPTDTSVLEAQWLNHEWFYLVKRVLSACSYSDLLVLCTWPDDRSYRSWLVYRFLKVPLVCFYHYCIGSFDYSVYAVLGAQWNSLSR